MNEPDPSILRYYLGIVWRWKWLLAATVAVLVVLALVSSLRQHALYSNSSGVLLNHQDQIAASLSGVQTPAEDAGRYAVTQTLVAQSPVLARRVLADLGQAGAPVRTLYDHTSVSSNADVLQFFVTGRSKRYVTRLANVYAEEFARYRRELDTQDLEATLSSLGARLDRLASAGQEQSALYAQLAARQEQVRLIELLRRSNVYVIRTTASDQAEQIAPRTSRNISLAIGGGLVLGLLLIAIANAFDRRVHDVRELEEALRAPLLARTARGGASADEGVRLAALLRHAARSANARAVLVAPAAGGDGTGLTTSLAEGLAAVQGKALLVDANLRGRGLTRHYDLEARPGLAEAAAADGAAPDVSHEVPSAAGHLRVVPAGAAAAQPAALVASDGVVRALHMLCAGPDVALVASAPLVAAPEAPVLASAVDGVLLLVEVGIDRRDVAELRRILDVSSSAPLGFVLLSRAPRGWSVAGRKGSAAATAATLEAQPMVGEA